MILLSCTFKADEPLPGSSWLAYKSQADSVFHLRGTVTLRGIAAGTR